MNDTPFSCGIEAALFVLGGKWKPTMLYHLTQGTRRYAELRRAVGGISDKVLIQHLKELQLDGIVARVDYGEIPPKVEYSLTEFGRSLAQTLAPLCQWGTKHMRDVEDIVERRRPDVRNAA